METTPKTVTVKIKDDLIADIYYFLTDAGLAPSSKFFNMVVRGDLEGPFELRQIFSKSDAGIEEKEISLVNDLVRSYFKIKGY